MKNTEKKQKKPARKSYAEIAKTDKLQRKQRIREVAEAILNGMFSEDIVSWATKKYDIVPRTAFKYINDAEKMLSGLPDEDMITKRKIHIERRMKLYRALENKGTSASAKTALNILDSIAKIDGSLVEQVDVKSDGKQITSGTVIILPNNGRDTSTSANGK